MSNVISPVSPAMAQPAPGGRMISSDFETFLRMLTTQLQNQDPLNPMQSTEFAVQLATFSGVEQQVRANQLLEGLAAGLGVGQLAQLSGWIGMEARVAAPVEFRGMPVSVVTNPDRLADSAVLVVRDSSGREVSREPIDIGGGEIIWAGTADDGGPLTRGRYDLIVESHAAGQLLGAANAEVYTVVREVRAGANGAAVLVFDDGMTRSAEAVMALRRPA